MSEVITFGRGTNHLGFITKTLKDLAGFSTLAHELIQNADDAGDAEELVFDIDRERVRLWNDGAFSDCGAQELSPRDCPWREDPAHASRCDFHSFRDVASGDKGGRSDTTGAFGIGFTAVYQITDHPQLISSGRHWTLNELAKEDQRITQCTDGGCFCRGLGGTTFVLPWVRTETPMRTELQAPPAGDAAASELVEILSRAIPDAMLFLRRLRRITLIADGETVATHERLEEDGRVIVTVDGPAGSEASTWTMLRGDFHEEAAQLRARYPGKFHDERSSSITVAVPHQELGRPGVLCAFLPTEQPSRLPAHVNADFVPTSDRRRVQHDGHSGEWNAAAIRALGRALAGGLELLRDDLEPRRLWELLLEARRAEAIDGDDDVTVAQRELWDLLSPAVLDSNVLYTIDDEWAPVEGALLFADEDEHESYEDVTRQLGLRMAHRDIRTILFQMRPLVELLTLSHITGAFSSCDEWAPADVASLLHLLEALVAGPPARGSQAAKRELGDLPVLADTDGRAVAPNGLRSGTSADVELLHDTLGVMAFVDLAQLPSGADSPLLGLVRRPTLAEVVQQLEDHAALEHIEERTAVKVLQWIQHRSISPDGSSLLDDTLRDRITALPLFPSSSHDGLHRLDDLVLPGGFEDVIGVAGVADTDALAPVTQLLRILDAEHLEIERYVVQYVPQAVDLARQEPARWRRLVKALASQVGRLSDDQEAMATLRELPLVRSDQGYVAGPGAYFASEQLADLVGDVPQVGDDVTGSERQLCEVLGVASDPVLNDVVGHLEAQVERWPSESVGRTIVAALTYFEACFDRASLGASDDAEWGEAAETLRDLEWIPVGDDLHRPSSIDLPFRRFIFSSTGQFPDLPFKLVQRCGDLLAELGAHRNPRPSQVVGHLRFLASSTEDWTDASDKAIPEIYRFLDENAHDPSLQRLRDAACIHVGQGRFVPPTGVFIGDHPFGARRHTLPPDFGRYADFLQALGVRQVPDADSARAVIREIGRERGEFNESLRDSDDLVIVMGAWELIADHLDTLDDEWFRSLGAVKSVPNGRAILLQPGMLVFNDAPHLLARLDRRDDPNIIQRYPKAGRAMERAGVMSLSALTSAELISVGTRRPADLLESRLRDRRPELVRILEHHGVQDPVRAADAIQDVSVMHADELRVAYSVPRLRIAPAPLEVDAHPVIEDETLVEVLVSVEHEFTPSLVRELLAHAGLGDQAVRTTSVVRDVLNAEDDDSASYLLDEYGYPPVVIREATSLEGAVAEPLADGEIDGDPGGDADPSAGHEATPGDHPRSEGGGSGDGEEGEGDTGSGLGAKAGDDVGGSHGASGTGVHGSEATAKDSDGATKRSRSKQRRTAQRTRLMSYVAPDGVGRDGTEDPEINARRKATDVAGIARVMEYERSQGRLPEEMPPNNKGWDITSRDATGVIVRHIEVKSTGMWDAYGVTMSSAQMEFARANRSTFWLYVVPNAQDDEHFEVVTIDDPATRISSYGIDQKWKAVAVDIGRAGGSEEVRPTVVDQQVDGALPYHDIWSDAAEVEPTGFVTQDSALTGGDYAVGVPADVLPDVDAIALGVVTVGVADVRDGDVVLVRLAEGTFPETGSPWGIRSWWPESDGSRVVTVSLGAGDGSNTAPMFIAGDDVTVFGRVVLP